METKMCGWSFAALVLGTLLILQAQTSAQDPKNTVSLKGHSNAVMSVAFSPDGKTLASGSADKTVRLWDIQTGKELASLEGHQKSVECVAFSPDGRTLASGAYDSTVKLWEIETRKERPALLLGTSFVHDVVFSPDGKTLATRTGFNGVIKLWDITTEKERASLTGFPGHGHRMCFTPSGEFLAVVGSDGALRFLDATTGKVQATLRGNGSKNEGIAISPDGKVVAFGNQLWDIEAKKPLHVLKGLPDATLGPFSPDGKFLATTSVVMQTTAKRQKVRAGIMTLWSTEKGRQQAVLKVHNPEHASHLFSVAFSPNGKTIAAGTADFRVMLVDLTELLEQNKK